MTENQTNIDLSIKYKMLKKHADRQKTCILALTYVIASQSLKDIGYIDEDQLEDARDRISRAMFYKEPE